MARHWDPGMELETEPPTAPPTAQQKVPASALAWATYSVLPLEPAMGRHWVPGKALETEPPTAPCLTERCLAQQSALGSELESARMTVLYLVLWLALLLGLASAQHLVPPLEQLSEASAPS